MKARQGVALLAVALGGLPASAQVVRDGSIGPATPLDVASGLDGNGDFADYLITSDLGEVSGGNLYHSFATFSVGPGEVATYTGPVDIDRIISRTTGANGSTISGTLRSTIEGADVFFISPGGIDILNGAQLEIPGSVVFSTAHSLDFGTAPVETLLADSLARPTILSAAPPGAFGFGPDAAPITLGANVSLDPLAVMPGETLAFVGGDITFTGLPGNQDGTVIEAPGANVELASTEGDQSVPLTEVDGRPRLDRDALPADALTGDIHLTLDAAIDVGAPGGSDLAAGSLLARAGNFRIFEGRIESAHRSDTEDSGDIDIGARNEILLGQRVGGGATPARFQIASFGDGRSADVRLAAETVTIGGGTSVQIGNVSDGASGDFSVDATTITIAERAEISSTKLGDGDGGDIVLTARGAAGEGTLMILGDGANASGIRQPSGLLSDTRRGEGTGGAIRLEADTIVLADDAEVISLTDGDAPGVGGSIGIQATSLTVEDGSFVSSVTESEATGGAVSVNGLDGERAMEVIVRNTPGTTEPEPARISTNTTANGLDAGDGGALAIRTDRLELTDGGQVFARTEGAGDAGVLEVEADTVRISGVFANPGDPSDPFRSGITSRVGDEGATGSGTLLSIDTRILEIEDGGQISTATFGIGDAGELRITSRERMTVMGGANGASVVSAQAVAGPLAPGGGRGGLITIETDRLELRDAGQISAATIGEGDPGEVGDAGDIEIRAGSVAISGEPGTEASGVFSLSDSVASDGIGNGGEIGLEIEGDLEMTGAARIEVSTSGDGDAGNIRAQVGGDVRLTDGAQILSSTDDQSLGNAGAIDLDVLGDVSLDGASEISSSTGVNSTGQGGSVAVESAGTLALSEEAGIRSRSEGLGDAGNIDIDAWRVLATRGSSVSTEADAASGGGINIDAVSRVELIDSSVTTSVQGSVGSDAGSIEIVSPGFEVVSSSAVVAQAVEGAGGRIEVFSRGTFISGDSLISASSLAGPQGEVELTPPENALISEIASLPAALEDPSQLLARACDQRTEREGSFTVRTNPALEAPPDERLPSLDAETIELDGDPCR